MPFDINRFAEVQAEIEAKASAIPGIWADHVVEYAVEDAPELTGYLKEHIVNVSSGDEGAAESQADYSSAVNFGTVHQHAQPYFTNAVEKANNDLPDIIAGEFG